MYPTDIASVVCFVRDNVRNLIPIQTEVRIKSVSFPWSGCNIKTRSHPPRLLAISRQRTLLLDFLRHKGNIDPLLDWLRHKSNALFFLILNINNRVLHNWEH